MPLSLLSVPAIAQGPTPPPSTTPTTPPKAPTTPTGKALAQAKKDNRRIEIESLRSESATYYANPDGKTLRMEQYLEPIRVKNAKGDGFTPIDTTLVEADGVIKPKAAKDSLLLSTGGNTEVIKSKSGNIAAQIDAPRTLPKPTLNGSTATYASAYGKGIDLVVTATPTGFRQQIVIRQRPAGPVTFRVPVELPKGIAFGENAKGQPTLKSDNGKRSLAIRPAALLDAAAADANADLGAVRIGRAQVSLDGSALVYSPDPAFLADPATTFPVTMAAVDDDWYECTLGGDPCPPGDPMDTYINDVDLTDSWDMHYRDQMWVGKSYASNIAKRWRAYIQFPLPQPSDPFWGSTIQNADLELWNYLSNDCGNPVGSGITARQVTSDWDHLSLQWNDQPTVTNTGADTEYGAYSPDCTGSMNYEHDLIHSVNTIVQAWADGETNYGIQLRAGNESEQRNWRRYRTREETSGYPAHGPRLTVDFEPPTPPHRETVVITSREPLTSIPDYEEAVTRSIYVPDTPESIDSLAMSEELAAATEQHRDGEGSFIGTDNLSPSVPYPGDGDDSDNPDGEDTATPRVRTTEPANEAIDVPLDSQVQVTFSEAVDGPIFSMKSAQGADVLGTTALDSTGEIATFTPTQPLRPGTKYTVEVSEATDSGENTMIPYSWSFRTVDQAAARWTFDEGNGRTAADSSGNDHDASLNETAAWIAGKSGNAVSNVPSQARIATSASAARQGKAVEVADETTATSITHAQPDGKTFKTEVAAGPVRTRQGNGWVAIDTTLAEQGGKLRPKAIAEGAVVEVSAGGTDPFVKMSADGKSYALSWPTPLPKPTVKGGVVTYTDAAGVGADLVVTVLPTGFRHDVVVRQRPSKPLELRIGVQTAGLTLSEGKGGRLLLTAGKGKKPVASAPQPVMWDASAKGRLPMARHAKIATDVVTKDGRTELVLKPDHAFLTDPATTYPVRVDPTTTLPFNDDVELYSEMDAGQTADPTLPYMLAGRLGSGLFRVHLRFDTTALTGTTVTDAKLSLLNIDAPTCGTQVGAGIQVRRLTSAWDENNLHWANKPTSTTEDAQINRTACEPTPMQWPVTAIAQDWAGGAANHGLVLQHPNETNTNDNYRLFPSAEDTDFNSPPTLTVTTSGPASAPQLTGLTVTPAQNADGITTVTSLTPQLAATVTDPAPGNLTGQFEIEHDPAAPEGQGTGQIWTGTSTAVTSGTQATTAVPAGTLTDGWQIRWRARAASTTTTSAWSDWQQATIDVPNPTVGAFQVTPSQVVNGITVATSLAPALHATVTDPAAQPLRAEFEVEHDPAATGQGTGAIWADAVDDVASGTPATATIPDGKLADGWNVRWRVRAVNTSTTVGSSWSDWQAVTVDLPDPVSEPAVGALQVSPSGQVDGATVTPTVTPALMAQVSDPAGKPLRAEVEVEHDPAATGQGTGQIWTGNADNVPTGTQASITVPADTLTDGWKARWRARAVSATAASAWSDWQFFTVSLPKPTATGLTVTPSKVVDGVTVTDTLTPTLQATLTHPTSQPLRAEAEIEHDLAAPQGQGSGQIWASAVDGVASGAEASIAVPAGTLSDGWKVRWRVRAVAGDASSAWSDWQQITVDVIQPGEEPLAQTAQPVIRTDQSFTAAAWLRWSDKDGDYIVTEQRGTHHAPFRLGNTAEHGLVFTFTNADATDATVEGVLSGVEPPADEWFHLAGTYDATTRTATLYLNGTQAGTAQLSFPAWDAQAPLRIGAAMAGSIDAVHIYQRPFSADDVASVIASVTAPAPEAVPAPQKGAASIQATAQTGDFDYDRLTLADCMASPSETGYADYDSRIRELPYNSCWSAYLYVQDFEQDPDSGSWRKANAKGTAPGTPASKSWGKQILDEILDGVTEPFDDDDAFRFRATWIIHSYLGDQTGNAVVDGAGTDFKPTDLKMFLRLDDFAVVDKDGRVKYSAGQLSGLPIRVMVDQGSSSPTTDCGDAAWKTADVSEWHAHPDATAVFHPKLPASGVAVCSILPVVNIYTDDGTLTLYLWNQKVLDEGGKTIGIRRHGSDSPYDLKWVPNFRCDRKVFGANNPDVEDRFGGCVNTRAKRVWIMSKSRDTEWTQVTEHIEAALNPSNKQTFPPRRLGHDWSKPSFPPPRDVPGKALENKAIPGNWAAPRDDPAGLPLTLGTNKVTNAENRKHFQQIDLHMDVGAPEENHWLLENVAKPYYINLCKYYERDKYPSPDKPLVLPYKKIISCDEYPFASVKEGAASARGNYSLRVVDTDANRQHGTAQWVFRADFRLAEGNKFWVLIED